jgi:hypothetical protein
MGRRSVQTTTVGYENRNGQVVRFPTGLEGTDHAQRVYVLKCGRCGNEYGANGSDIWQRRCPQRQRGRPGIPYR